uniref:Uncharacterized protein n=1 Tax=Arundo donax TaxID=35708 RepID=A0A0A9HA02_ARUDO
MICMLISTDTSNYFLHLRLLIICQVISIWGEFRLKNRGQ